MAQLPEAVLWDMDGTLVDTEPYWIDAEFALADRHGGSWSSDHALNLVGPRPAGLRPLHPRAHGDRPRALRHRRGAAGRGGGADRGGGARGGRARASSSRSCREAGVPLGAGHDVLPPVRRPGAGRAASRHLRRRRDRRRGEPRQAVPGPVPQGGGRAARRRGRCLAIEDSDTGATSAGRAGCLVLVVPSHVAVPEGEGRVFRDVPRGTPGGRPPGAGRRVLGPPDTGGVPVASPTLDPHPKDTGGLEMMRRTAAAALAAAMLVTAGTSVPAAAGTTRRSARAAARARRTGSSRSRPTTAGWRSRPRSTATCRARPGAGGSPTTAASRPVAAGRRAGGPGPSAWSGGCPTWPGPTPSGSGPATTARCAAARIRW